MSAKGGAVAVCLVGGDPPFRHLDLHRRGDHFGGQVGLGGELNLDRYPGGSAPIRVVGPRRRQVDPAVDQRVPTGRSVGKEHPDLAVLDPPGRARVLPLHSHRVHAFLQVSVSSATSTPSACPSRPTISSRRSSRAPSASHTDRYNNRCIASGR